MEALEQEIKVGKRLASGQVNQLKEAIKLLLAVMGYVGYEDNVDRLLMEVEAENKDWTRYEPEKAEENKPKPKTSSGGTGKSGANWTAGVGQTIIGNLARGEGGRFVSAANISSMMNQLEKENISPDMFTAMQDLLSGKEVSPDVLKQLQAAGLATEDGQASAKAAQILTSMKTGDPDQLKTTLSAKPGKTGKGGGKGSKPKKAPKPTKDEITATNIQETGLKIIEQGRITDVQLSALNKFANGETVDNSLMQELVAKGLVEIDENGYFSFTSAGNGFWSALEKADLRKALDSLNKAESNVASEIEAQQAEAETDQEVEAKIQETKDEFVRLTQFPELTNFLDFFNGKEVDVDFSKYGLTELDSNGNQITTRFGKQFAQAIQKGKLRDAVDAYRKAVASIEETEKNFDTENNLDCTGFKIFEDDNDAYILTWTTNAYQDREGEFFTLKAIEDYVQRNIESEAKGVYQFWHVPGSEFADIVAQVVAGKFLAEIGKFRKDEIGEAFKQFFKQYWQGHPTLAPDGWGCSHGFVYKREDRQDGIYEWFDKKESTILPLNEAANIFTVIQLFEGEKSMELSDKQVAAFEEVGKAIKKPNLLQKILDLGKKRTELIDNAGFESKQVQVKTEDGYEYPEKCFLYVPDAEKPSTWKLRICAPESTEVTREQLGAAAAAFSPGGFRGQKVELPQADIAKVKTKLREEYAKLGVKEEDVPQSIKEVEVKSLQEKFAEASKACATDLRKKMEDALATMEKEDGDKVEMLRQLSELVAQVQEEELRNALTEIVTAMQAMYTPVETEEEEVAVEVEMPVEEEVVKELDTETIAKALKLDQLSDLLEAQQKAIDENKVDKKALEDLAKAMVELSQKQIEDADKYKVLFDELVAAKKELSELKKEDEVKVAEKQARFTPYWGSRYQASKAAETVLSEDEAKEYRGPEVPSVIQSMSRKFMGGK